LTPSPQAVSLDSFKTTSDEILNPMQDIETKPVLESISNNLQ
jgi:hypothetical protein